MSGDPLHADGHEEPESKQGEHEQAHQQTEPPAQAASAAAAMTEAAGGDGASLDPGDERDLWSGRTHWKHFAGRLTLWALANLVLTVLLVWVSATSDESWLTFWRTVLIILAVVALSGLVIVGKIIVKILGCRYRVTTQRLFIETGLFSKSIEQTELIRVDDVSVYKSFLDRVFGLGDVLVISTDRSDTKLVLEGVKDPETVGETIRGRMRSMRRKSLFVENL